MSNIKIDVNCNAPCCPCQIVSCDNPKLLILLQTDWEFPSFAQAFGWCLTDVQLCRKCHQPLSEINSDSHPFEDVKCLNCNRKKGNVFCDHSHSDGTVDCQDCGVKVKDFIESAYEFLSNNDGLEAEDPGYFTL